MNHPFTNLSDSLLSTWNGCDVQSVDENKACGGIGDDPGMGALHSRQKR